MRYCDTIAAIPRIARYFLRQVSTPPKWCDTPLWYLVSHRGICAIPHFATYRAIIVRYLRLQKSTVGGSPGPKIGNFSKNWQFLLFIGSDFLLEIQFLAIFGQYSFQQYFFGSLDTPIKTSTKEFCDTIAASIARYEKYRCWASKQSSSCRVDFPTLFFTPCVEFAGILS